MKTYIIYYYDADNEPEAYEVLGSKNVVAAVKWVKSIGGKVSLIYKRGKDFENDHDDVIDVTSSYVK